MSQPIRTAYPAGRIATKLVHKTDWETLVELRDLLRKAIITAHSIGMMRGKQMVSKQ